MSDTKLPNSWEREPPVNSVRVVKDAVVCESTKQVRGYGMGAVVSEVLCPIDIPNSIGLHLPPGVDPARVRGVVVERAEQPKDIAPGELHLNGGGALFQSDALMFPRPEWATVVDFLPVAREPEPVRERYYVDGTYVCDREENCNFAAGYTNKRAQQIADALNAACAAGEK